MKRYQTVSQKVSAWQIRIVALAFIVLSVAGGSHMLVNAFAATNDENTQTQHISTDGNIFVPMHRTQSKTVIKHVPFKGVQPTGTSHR